MRIFFIILSGVYVAVLGVIAGVIPIFGGLYLNTHRDKLSYSFAAIFIFLIMALWLVLTGIGVIRRKNWARNSIFAMSFFAIFMGLIFCIISLFQGVLSPGLAPNLIFVAVPTVFLIAVPVFFLIFFTRKKVKESFVPEGQELKKSPTPFGIKFIAVLTLIGAISLLINAFSPPYQKLPFFGTMLISGISLRIYLFISASISFYIALGLLRLRKAGWVIYVIYNIFVILSGIANTFGISEATLLDMMPRMTDAPQRIPMIVYRISGSVGALISVIFLVYVILKRRLFFKKALGG